MELSVNQFVDTDVANMGRWGVLFRDCPVTFSGAYKPSDLNGMGNIWNYIDTFGKTSDASHPEQRWGGGDTPVFWNAWNETTTNYEDRPAYNFWASDDEFLADWERELIGESINVGHQLAHSGNYSDHIRALFY